MCAVDRKLHHTGSCADLLVLGVCASCSIIIVTASGLSTWPRPRAALKDLCFVTGYTTTTFSYNTMMIAWVAPTSTGMKPLATMSLVLMELQWESSLESCRCILSKHLTHQLKACPTLPTLVVASGHVILTPMQRSEAGSLDSTQCRRRNLTLTATQPLRHGGMASSRSGM